MREILFRGWNSIKKIMYSAEKMGHDQLTISVDGRGFVNVSGQSLEKSHFISNIIPEQFTGLKDKNGKDIYEGDIVEHESSDYHVKGSVVYNEKKAEYSVDGKKGKFTLGIMPDLFSIIGNIHENPELLTNPKNQSKL